MSFIKFECQSPKWARFWIRQLTLIATYVIVPVLVWVESREFSCHAFIGFLIGLFILLWLSIGNLFKSFGEAFLILMISKPGRTL